MTIWTNCNEATHFISNIIQENGAGRKCISIKVYHTVIKLIAKEEPLKILLLISSSLSLNDLMVILETQYV